MKQAIKKLFDWTPRDIAAWEKMRQPGMWHFVVWYGVRFFGAAIFIIAAGITLFSSIRAHDSLSIMLFQLAFAAAVCLLAGIVTGLLTWWLEGGIYHKIKK